MYFFYSFSSSCACSSILSGKYVLLLCVQCCCLLFVNINFRDLQIGLIELENEKNDAIDLAK